MAIHFKRLFLLMASGLCGVAPSLAETDTAALSLSEETFQSCLQQLKAQALQKGMSPSVMDQEFSRIRYRQDVIQLDRKQPEFSETFYNYWKTRVSQQRIQTGRELLKTHSVLLQQLEQQYGVAPQYLLAFWGLETNFGGYLGNTPVLDSLATLACDERRSDFFTGELLTALQLVDAGVATGKNMVGSWAGAMGNMQFMPSAYRQYGVDADGDGRADLWKSIPDALTSAANFLQKLGWEKGYRWGREVQLPSNFDYTQSGREKQKTLSTWSQLGVKRINGQPLPSADLEASIILPSGYSGPALLVYPNFHVIMRWNRSEFYAVSVGLLADQIDGGDSLKQWPPDVKRLSVEDVKIIQSGLIKAGFDVGEVDGVLGSNTRRAVQAYQKQKGLIADGYPDSDVIALLKGRLNSE